jgi:hypothetical protein
MKLLDKIALNRLISIITNFILGVLKLITPKIDKPVDVPKPKRPKIFPWRNKDE